MRTTKKSFVEWIQSLPIEDHQEIEIESLLPGGNPSTAKRVLAYEDEQGIPCICTNSMGTHFSDEFYRMYKRLGIFQP